MPSLTGIVAWEGRTDGRGGTWSREAVERLGRAGLGVQVEERDGELVATLTTEVSHELYASIHPRPVGCSVGR